MNQLDVDEWQYLTSYVPKEFKKNQLTENVKKNQAGYFLAGKLEGKRSDQNLQYKTIVSLDYDNVQMLYTKFADTLKERLRGYQFMMYPTFNNGLKGLRYRVLINTERSYTKDENKLLVTNVADFIGLPFDRASVTYSQVAGLPVITPYSSKKMIKVFEGEPLKVDSFLFKAEKQEFNRPNFRPTHQYYQGVGGKGKVVQILEQFAEGVGEGGRNSFMTKATGTLLKADMTPSSAYRMLYVLNANFCNPPLTDSEFSKIIESVHARESRRREVVT